MRCEFKLRKVELYNFSRFNAVLANVTFDWTFTGHCVSKRTYRNLLKRKLDMFCSKTLIINVICIKQEVRRCGIDHESRRCRLFTCKLRIKWSPSVHEIGILAAFKIFYFTTTYVETTSNTTYKSNKGTF